MGSKILPPFPQSYTTASPYPSHHPSFFLSVLLPLPPSTLLYGHHPLPIPPSPPSSGRRLDVGSLFLKPTTTIPSSSLSYKLVSNSSASLNATSTASSSLSFDLLEQHLASQDFRQADEEIRRLLIVFAGEAAVKRGYAYFSEVQFVSELDLKAIDELLRQHSNGRYGYSVQKRIWEKSRRDFTKFFVKVGWMKLDTEVEQYSYRAFPDQFFWEMDDNTPEGHLP